MTDEISAEEAKEFVMDFADGLQAQLRAATPIAGKQPALQLECSDGSHLLITLIEHRREGTILDG